MIFQFSGTQTTIIPLVNQVSLAFSVARKQFTNSLYFFTEKEKKACKLAWLPILHLMIFWVSYVLTSACPFSIAQGSFLRPPAFFNHFLSLFSAENYAYYFTHTHRENLMYQVTSLSTAPDICLYTLLHIRSGICASIQILSFCLCSNKVILELEHAPEPAGGPANTPLLQILTPCIWDEVQRFCSQVVLILPILDHPWSILLWIPSSPASQRPLLHLQSLSAIPYSSYTCKHNQDLQS